MLSASGLFVGSHGEFEHGAPAMPSSSAACAVYRSTSVQVCLCEKAREMGKRQLAMAIVKLAVVMFPWRKKLTSAQASFPFLFFFFWSSMGGKSSQVCA